MIYAGKLASGQQLFVENRDDQTVVTLSASDETQSQTQGRSFSTGVWQQPPALFETAKGGILRVPGADKTFFFEVRATSINALDAEPPLDDKDTVALHETDTGPKPMEPMKPMKPMEPMKPMKPL